jgi:rod shape-determining protein MreD
MNVTSVNSTILRPVNPVFIAFSLFVAFFLSVVAWPVWLPVPDFLALVLVFWNVHQPRKVGMGLAWFFGLLMDVHRVGILGETALAYTLLSYFAITLHRRVLWFSVWTQAVHVLPLFMAAQMVTVAVRLFLGWGFPGWGVFLSGLWNAVLWPSVTVLLMAPQRRPLDRDENRPL